MNPTPATPEQREHFMELLKQFSTAMLVTHAGSDQLRARPMAIAEVDAQGRIWFITSSETAKAYEIATDTRVHLVLQQEHDAYISIAGRATLVDDRMKVSAVWQEPFRVWFPEGQDDPEIQLIRVEPQEVEFWDNQGQNRVHYMFEAVKAYVKGSTPEIHEGDEHAFVKL